MASYKATTYAADGHSDSTATVYDGDSLDEAREAVARHLGVPADSLAPLRWAGVPDDGDVEAYHEFPADHPSGYGCGGVAIRRQESR